MKSSSPLLIILFVIFSACTRKIPANAWLLGATPEQVKTYMLSKPGNSLEADRIVENQRELVFHTNNYSSEFFFYFRDDVLESRLIKSAGIHEPDINELYKKYQRLGENDWIDNLKEGKISLHREYDGDYTLMTIKLKQ